MTAARTFNQEHYVSPFFRTRLCKVCKEIITPYNKIYHKGGLNLNLTVVVVTAIICLTISYLASIGNKNKEDKH